MKPYFWLRKLACTSLLIFGLPIGIVMGFNYYIDPEWSFDHKHEYNDVQRGYNERLQKANWINAQQTFSYDSLMIGTSRTTYINSHQFNEKLFNFGLSNLHITEYLDVLRYAKEKNEKQFSTIYVELTIASYDSRTKATFTNTDEILRQADDPFNKYVNLFSNETFERAKENYEMSVANASNLPRNYDRDLQVFTTFESKNLERNLQNFKQLLAARDESVPDWMIYLEDYVSILKEIKALFPNAKIIPFNDLIWSERLNYYIHHPQVTPAYKQYVTDVVTTFGEFYSFHQYNDITTDASNFLDLYHFYPHVGDIVSENLQKREPNEVLYIVTKDNLDAYFNSLGI